ncbi:MAG: metalloregulator ArsR/SmtB family transcription factor [Pseudomonadota bacterium]
MLHASDATSIPVFAALGDRTRLELIARLSDGRQRSIVDLAAGLDLTRQGVTKHLKVLKQAGLVSCERVGRESRFALQPQPIADARDCLARASRQWDEAIDRLRAAVDV